MNPIQSISNAVTGVADTARGIVDVAGRLQTGSYWAQLRKASWRGIPFVAVESESAFGRRVQVHEYPNRDTPWVEDLGRRQREFQVAGYLVGDDVIAQRDRLVAAAEARSSAGGDELVHPSFGLRKVALIDFRVGEHIEHGRKIEIAFTFVEQGQRQFPGTSAAASLDAVDQAAGQSDLAAAQAFAKRALSALQDGATVVNRVSQTAAEWGDRATQVVRDATSLVHLATALPGSFGRLFDRSSSSKASSTTTVKGLIAQAAAARQAVDLAVDRLQAGAAGLSGTTMDAFSSSALGLAAAVAAAAARPADGVRALVALSGYQPDVLVDPSRMGVSTATAQRAAADLYRRGAVAQLARVASTYRLDSTDDAQRLRATVLDALDTEIVAAADQGEDDAFAALRALRLEVVRDLNVRGASLPDLVTIASPVSQPVLVLAQRYYRDAARESEMVARARPIHPAFMPRTFEALSE